MQMRGFAVRKMIGICDNDNKFLNGTSGMVHSFLPIARIRAQQQRRIQVRPMQLSDGRAVEIRACPVHVGIMSVRVFHVIQCYRNCRLHGKTRSGWVFALCEHSTCPPDTPRMTEILHAPSNPKFPLTRTLHFDSVLLKVPGVPPRSEFMIPHQRQPSYRPR